MGCRDSQVLDQIRVLVSRDFKLKYNLTALGFLWSFLVPALQSLVYWSVFSSVARFNIKDYLLYMLSGMFLWYFFSNCVSVSLKSFVNNGGLIKKTPMNRSMLVFSRVLTEWLHLLLVIPLLLVIMLFFHQYPAGSLLLLPVVLILLFFFTAGICFVVATMNLYFRDLERILSVILQALFFMSPVIYAFENISGGIGQILRFNPLAYFIMAWRNIFYSPQIDWGIMGLTAVFSLASFCIGYSIYKLKEPEFAEKV